MKNLGRYKRMNVGSVAQFGSGLCWGTFLQPRVLNWWRELLLPVGMREISYFNNRDTYIARSLIFFLLFVFLFVLSSESVTFGDSEFSSRSMSDENVDARGMPGKNMEIQGYVLDYLYGGKVKGSATVLTNHFSVTLAGLRSRLVLDSRNPAISSIEYGFLGKDSYILTRLATNYTATNAYTIGSEIPKEVKLEKPTRPENESIFEAIEGRVPGYGNKILSSVWLAFCSRMDLPATNGNVRTISTPVFTPTKIANDYKFHGGKCEVVCELHPDSLLFLENWNEIMYPKHFESVGMSSPYPDTFTNAIYHTKLWTNIAGFVLPKEFCITNFYAQTGKYSVFEGIVTNISLISHIKEFEIPLRTYVKEQRHSLVAPLKSFAYLTTNGALFDKKQIQKTEQFENEVIALPSPPRRLYSFVVLLIIVLVSLFPLIIWKLLSKYKIKP